MKWESICWKIGYFDLGDASRETKISSVVFLRSNIELAQLARVSPSSEWHLNLHKSLHFIHIYQSLGFLFFSRVLSDWEILRESLRVCFQWIFCITWYLFRMNLHCVTLAPVACVFIVLSGVSKFRWTISNYAPFTIPIKESYISMEKLVE